MIRTMLVLACVGFLGLTGCKSAQEREADAKAAIAEERLKVIKNYTDCIDKYEKEGGSKDKCSHYKEAAEALTPKE